MLTTKVVGVEGGREPACGEFPSTFVVSIVPTQPNCALVDTLKSIFERFVDVSVLSLMYQQVSIPMEPAAQQRYD